MSKLFQCVTFGALEKLDPVSGPRFRPERKSSRAGREFLIANSVQIFETCFEKRLNVFEATDLSVKINVMQLWAKLVNFSM